MISAGRTGFTEKIVGAATKRADSGFERGPGCQEQHSGYRAAESEGAKGVGELETAHVRHVEIADDDRDLFARGDDRERLFRVAADGALEAGAGQHTLEECEGGEIVVE